MSDRSKTVLEVQADISNIMSKLSIVKKSFPRRLVKPHKAHKRLVQGLQHQGNRPMQEVK